MKNKYVLFLVLAGAVTLFDLASKSYVFAKLPTPRDRVAVCGEVFEIVHHTNPGGMWGVGADWNQWVLRIVRFAAVIVVFIILAQTPAGDRWSVAALGLVMGGAVGNIYDSLRMGEVRDFLKFDFGFPPFAPFPTFNVADSAICVGVGLLAVQMLFFSADARKKQEESRPEEK